jgi:adenylate kinase
VEFALPARPGICDRCGGALTQRSDDRKETVEARLSVYEEQTAPLVRYYRERGLLSELDGSGAIEGVHGRLLELLKANGLG